jgi:hypothetical protein
LRHTDHNGEVEARHIPTAANFLQRSPHSGVFAAVGTPFDPHQFPFNFNVFYGLHGSLAGTVSRRHGTHSNLMSRVEGTRRFFRETLMFIHRCSLPYSYWSGYKKAVSRSPVYPSAVESLPWAVYWTHCKNEYGSTTGNGATQRETCGNNTLMMKARQKRKGEAARE